MERLSETDLSTQLSSFLKQGYQEFSRILLNKALNYHLKGHNNPLEKAFSDVFGVDNEYIRDMKIIRAESELELQINTINKETRDEKAAQTIGP